MRFCACRWPFTVISVRGFALPQAVAALCAPLWKYCTDVIADILWLHVRTVRLIARLLTLSATFLESMARSRAEPRIERAQDRMLPTQLWQHSAPLFVSLVSACNAASCWFPLMPAYIDLTQELASFSKQRSARFLTTGSVVALCAGQSALSPWLS